MVAPFVAQQIPRKIGSHSAKTPTFIRSGLTSPLSSTPSFPFFCHLHRTKSHVRFGNLQELCTFAHYICARISAPVLQIHINMRSFILNTKSLAKVLTLGLFATSLFGVTSCEEEIDSSNFAIKKMETLSDIMDGNPQLSKARDLFKQVRLGRKGNSSSVYSVLSARGNYTVFAPDNEAVDAYLKSLELTSIDELTDEQKELIVYSCVIDLQSFPRRVHSTSRTSTTACSHVRKTST